MKQTITSQNSNWILFWVYVVVASTVITMLSSCGTRKVIIDEVMKDSLSQIYTKIETKEDIKIETKNDIVIDEFTITPIDTCKDIVVNGITYKNAILRYKKTKDKSIYTEKKIASKIEDKQQSTKEKTVEKKKEVERKSFNILWIIIISLIVVVWLNKQYLLSLLRRM